MNQTNTKMRVLLAGLTLPLLLGLLLSGCAPSSVRTNPTTIGASSQLKGAITVSGAFALYPMMVKWAGEFERINSGVKIEVSAGGAGKGMADALGGLVDLGMVSREVLPAEIDKGAVYVAVAIDAVVPTVNAANPVKDEILAKGISRQQFVDIFITGKITDWKQVYPDAKPLGKTNIDIYTRSDSSGAGDAWAGFLGKKQEDLLGIGVYGDPGLAETVKRDPLAIGFNNISYAYDAKTKKKIDGLMVVPIDVNANGKIDPEEDFYGSLESLDTAIVSKAYPWPPARQENIVTLREFKGVTREFVKWVLTDGQKYASEAGYIPLPPDTASQQLAKIK